LCGGRLYPVSHAARQKLSRYRVKPCVAATATVSSCGAGSARVTNGDERIVSRYMSNSSLTQARYARRILASMLEHERRYPRGSEHKGQQQSAAMFSATSLIRGSLGESHVPQLDAQLDAPPGLCQACGPGTCWRAPASRAPEPRSWRGHDSEPTSR
jgi:hypothetical protein